MLSAPIPRGVINHELAKVASYGDLRALKIHLQEASNQLGRIIRDDNSIPEENKAAKLMANLADYINKAEPNLYGQTALHFVATTFPTASDRDLEAMLYLLKLGANPNAQDENGNSLMHHYASTCFETTVEFAKKSQKSRQPEETSAILKKHLTRMCTLACYLADPYLTNKEGKSSLNILKELDIYLKVEMGLEQKILAYYTTALQGETPTEEIDITIPQNFLEAKRPEGPYASKVSAGRAANKNQKNSNCCVLL